MRIIKTAEGKLYINSTRFIMNKNKNFIQNRFSSNYKKNVLIQIQCAKYQRIKIYKMDKIRMWNANVNHLYM